MQYIIGTVSVQSGQNIVTGAGTTWLTSGITAGYTFKLKNENAEYTIGAISGETRVQLTSTYVGSGQAGVQYQLTKDFTPNISLPEIWAGDIDWPWHVTQALRKADLALANMKYVTAGNGYLATTNSSSGMLSYYNISANYVGTLEAVVAARCTGGTRGAIGQGAAFKIVAGINRYSGEVSILGTTTITQFKDPKFSGQVGIQTLSGQLRIMVTGGGNDNVSWVSASELITVSV